MKWYTAYNLTKHDRETFLELANLENCISACAAIFVMSVAQFGRSHFEDSGEFPQRLFSLERVPIFEQDEQYQLEGIEDENMVRKKYGFDFSKA